MIRLHFLLLAGLSAAQWNPNYNRYMAYNAVGYNNGAYPQTDYSGYKGNPDPVPQSFYQPDPPRPEFDSNNGYDVIFTVAPPIPVAITNPHPSRISRGSTTPPPPPPSSSSSPSTSTSLPWWEIEDTTTTQFPWWLISPVTSPSTTRSTTERSTTHRPSTRGSTQWWTKKTEKPRPTPTWSTIQWWVATSPRPTPSTTKTTITESPTTTTTERTTTTTAPETTTIPEEYVNEEYDEVTTEVPSTTTEEPTTTPELIQFKTTQFKDLNKRAHLDFDGFNKQMTTTTELSTTIEEKSNEDEEEEREAEEMIIESIPVTTEVPLPSSPRPDSPLPHPPMLFHSHLEDEFPRPGWVKDHKENKTEVIVEVKEKKENEGDNEDVIDSSSEMKELYEEVDETLTSTQGSTSEPSSTTESPPSTITVTPLISSTPPSTPLPSIPSEWSSSSSSIPHLTSHSTLTHFTLPSLATESPRVVKIHLPFKRHSPLPLDHLIHLFTTPSPTHSSSSPPPSSSSTPSPPSLPSSSPFPSSTTTIEIESASDITPLHQSVASTQSPISTTTEEPTTTTEQPVTVPIEVTKTIKHKKKTPKPVPLGNLNGNPLMFGVQKKTTTSTTTITESTITERTTTVPTTTLTVPVPSTTTSSPLPPSSSPSTTVVTSPPTTRAPLPQTTSSSPVTRGRISTTSEEEEIEVKDTTLPPRSSTSLPTTERTHHHSPRAITFAPQTDRPTTRTVPTTKLTTTTPDIDSFPTRIPTVIVPEASRFIVHSTTERNTHSPSTVSFTHPTTTTVPTTEWTTTEESSIDRTTTIPPIDPSSSPSPTLIPISPEDFDFELSATTTEQTRTREIEVELPLREEEKTPFAPPHATIPRVRVSVDAANVVNEEGDKEGPAGLSMKIKKIIKPFASSTTARTITMKEEKKCCPCCAENLESLTPSHPSPLPRRPSHWHQLLEHPSDASWPPQLENDKESSESIPHPTVHVNTVPRSIPPHDTDYLYDEDLTVITEKEKEEDLQSQRAHFYPERIRMGKMQFEREEGERLYIAHPTLSPINTPSSTARPVRHSVSPTIVSATFAPIAHTNPPQYVVNFYEQQQIPLRQPSQSYIPQPPPPYYVPPPPPSPPCPCAVQQTKPCCELKPCCRSAVICPPPVPRPCCQPQQQLCCQPNLFEQMMAPARQLFGALGSLYAPPANNCGVCQGSAYRVARVKRSASGCSQCSGRRKRETTNEQHNRNKRTAGCISRAARAKRSANGNCADCSSINGIFRRQKRTADCSPCDVRGKREACPCAVSPSSYPISHLSKRSKREVNNKERGYETLLTCDSSCCDFSRCDQLRIFTSKKKVVV